MQKKTKIILGVSFTLAIIAGVILFIKGRKTRRNEGESKSLNNTRSIDPEVEDKALSDKFNFHLIPDGLNNYRSAQITADQLPNVIKKYGIKHIIRLNGDGTDSQHKSAYGQTPKSVEKQVAEDNGAMYHEVGAHSGYRINQGYLGTLNEVLPILAQGNTLVHCAHGADRTGYIVAAHLKNSGKMTDKDQLWAYTTQFNGWQKMVDKGTFFGSGYDKYADAFYPINELGTSKWVKK
jgi:hypothetical protein